jgi:RNA polymerase sigma factor (sigma-70 family)
LLLAVRDLTVTELIKQCVTIPVDEGAWLEFVRRYDSVIRTCVFVTFHRRAKQEHERRQQFPDSLGEDLVQGVYMRLIDEEYRALKHFSGSSHNSLCAYLSMISVNVVRDHFREARAQKRPKITFSLDQLLDEQRDGPLHREAVSQLDGRPLTHANRKLTIDDVESALRVVLTGENRHRDALIFKLRHYDGLTLEEIRDVLHLDLSTVSVGSVLNRTASKLRVVLEHRGRRG